MPWWTRKSGEFAAGGRPSAGPSPPPAQPRPWRRPTQAAGQFLGFLTERLPHDLDGPPLIGSRMMGSEYDLPVDADRHAAADVVAGELCKHPADAGVSRKMTDQVRRVGRLVVAERRHQAFARRQQRLRELPRRRLTRIASGRLRTKPKKKAEQAGLSASTLPRTSTVSPIRLLGAVVLLLGDAGALAAQAAQVIQLGAADLAAAHDLDRVDHRRVEREHALDALAVGDLADREVLLQARAGAADADALVGLDAGLSPSTIFTLTMTVSPGWKSGISLPAVSLATCSFSSSWIKFMGKSPGQRHPGGARSCRTVRVGRASTIMQRTCHPPENPRARPVKSQVVGHCAGRILRLFSGFCAAPASEGRRSHWRASWLRRRIIGRV